MKMKNDNLYKELHTFSDENKLPVCDSIQFKRLTDTYTKEVFRETLSEYIATEKPKFPLRTITKEKVREVFYDLINFDTSKICTPEDQNQNHVFEKYDDYKYPYSKYGLGLIEASSQFNDISNAFHQDLRLDCGTYKIKSPKETWEKGTPKEIWSTLGGLWRGVNSKADLSPESYIEVIRLGTYIATQFKPVVAKTIYDMTNARYVLDTSCGWGDRLAGFYASNAFFYVGCDPNPNTFERYKEQCIYYEKLNGCNDPQIYEHEHYFNILGNKHVSIFKMGSEDLNEIQLSLKHVTRGDPLCTGKFDVAFTSPPYFSTEKYNAGYDEEENQSWHKYDTYEKWRDNFYLKTAEIVDKYATYNFVNIMDPMVKGKRYRSGDELVDRFKDKFLGQIGMKIRQRPKSDKLFESEEEKKKFESSTFIENVWCFGPKDQLDFFRNSRVATLDQFFE